MDEQNIKDDQLEQDLKDEREAEDYVNEMWDEGLCLSCGKYNDNKERNLRICRECEEKEDDGSAEDIAVQQEIDKRLGK